MSDVAYMLPWQAEVTDSMVFQAELSQARLHAVQPYDQVVPGHQWLDSAWAGFEEFLDLFNSLCTCLALTLCGNCRLSWM